MRIKSAIAATLTVIFSVSITFADNVAAASQSAAKTQTIVMVEASRVKETDSIQTARIKNILFKLARQDEYLDEAIETIESSNGKLSIQDISALGLSFRIIKGDLDAISALNKKELPEVRPDPGVNTYTKTILSYSRSVSQKIVRVGGLVASLTNNTSAMRDAVFSRKGGKTANGKKLTRILEEQEAVKNLSTDIRLLKTSSGELNATSRWLYIVSK